MYALEKTVILPRWWLQIAGNQDRYHEGVDRYDPSHDHWYERLSVPKSVSVPWQLRCALLTFIIRSGLKVPTPAIPMPDFAVPYAAPIPK